MHLKTLSCLELGKARCLSCFFSFFRSPSLCLLVSLSLSPFVLFLSLFSLSFSSSLSLPLILSLALSPFFSFLSPFPPSFPTPPLPPPHSLSGPLSLCLSPSPSLSPPLCAHL